MFCNIDARVVAAAEARKLHSEGLTYREVDELLNLVDRFPTAAGHRYSKSGEVFTEVAYFLTKRY